MSKVKETGTTEAVPKENAAPDAKEKKKGNQMYLGPTINGVARHGTVFKNGVLPGRVQECIREFPAMERLFVETGKMPEAVKELKRKQSVLETVYAGAEERFCTNNPRKVV